MLVSDGDQNLHSTASLLSHPSRASLTGMKEEPHDLPVRLAGAPNRTERLCKANRGGEIQHISGRGARKMVGPFTNRKQAVYGLDGARGAMYV